MSLTITIEVLAGMANRLRAMVSAMCLADDLDAYLHVIWPANDPACMGRFENLFDPTSLPKWMRVDLGPRESEGIMVLSPEDMEVFLKGDQRKVITSYGHFYQKDPAKWLRFLRSIRPMPNYHAQLIQMPIFQHRERLVGVHIRRGDHQKARTYSPLEAFIEAMRAESPETLFIVATDDKKEKEALLATFGAERLHFPAQVLTRASPKGMQDALLDFLALSRTQKILASFGSSFSELAAAYGAIPLHVVKKSA